MSADSQPDHVNGGCDFGIWNLDVPVAVLRFGVTIVECFN